jgi:hypothetical protein
MHSGGSVLAAGLDPHQLAYIVPEANYRQLTGVMSCKSRISKSESQLRPRISKVDQTETPKLTRQNGIHYRRSPASQARKSLREVFVAESEDLIFRLNCFSGEGVCREIEGQVDRGFRRLQEGQGDLGLVRHARSQGKFCNIPSSFLPNSFAINLYVGRDQVLYRGEVRARELSAIPSQQPLLEDFRSLRPPSIG